MTETLAQTDEERALERIARNQLLIAELTAENDQLKTFFKERSDAYPAGTLKRVGKFYIKVSAGTRLDDTLAQQHLSTSEYKRVSKLTLDTKKARAFLTSTTLEKITKKFENRIEIGIN